VTTPEILAVAATLAGVLMAAAPFLQIRRMLHTRSSRDVSLLYLSLLEGGFLLWLAYGWSIGNAALILSNIASISFMTVTIAFAIAFRRGKGRDQPDQRPSKPAPGTKESATRP
jgi:MtN3 and saliva related transmembrane protein